MNNKTQNITKFSNKFPCKQFFLNRGKQNSHCGSVVKNLTHIHEDKGLTPIPTQLHKDLELPRAVV